jgi:flagellar biosynthesis chaperone FliJ
VNARRDKKSLEILRDKALQRFLQALGRAETAALDEISLRPFVAPGAAEAAREREA